MDTGCSDEQLSSGIQHGTLSGTLSEAEAQKQAKLALIKTFFEAQLLCNQFNQIYAQQAAARGMPVMLTVIPPTLLPEGLMVIPAPISAPTQHSVANSAPVEAADINKEDIQDGN